MTVHEITLRLDVPSSSSSNDLPSPRGCSASSLGYRCVVALAPSVNLHWTSGGAAEAEDEPEADAAPGILVRRTGILLRSLRRRRVRARDDGRVRARGVRRVPIHPYDGSVRRRRRVRLRRRRGRARRIVRRSRVLRRGPRRAGRVVASDTERVRGANVARVSHRSIRREHHGRGRGSVRRNGERRRARRMGARVARGGGVPRRESRRGGD